MKALPFAAITGMDAAKRALLLLAVDPELRGVLIAAGPGTAKSLLVRSFRELVAGEKPLPHGRGSVGPVTEPRPSGSGPSGTPWIHVPLGVTEDRLLGGLDLERSLTTGRIAPVYGLLAAADGGFLIADDVNLLNRKLAAYIAGALDGRTVRLERDSVTAVHPARFAVIATCDPAEGEVSSTLSDSIGLHVGGTGGSACPLDCVSILTLLSAFDSDPDKVIRAYTAETQALRVRIEVARELLAKVVVTRKRRLALSEAASSLGVEGHRGEVFALRAARASAALDERKRVEDDDLTAAIELCLVPRSRRAVARSEKTEEPEEPGTDGSDPVSDRATEMGSLPSVPGFVLPPRDTTFPDELPSGAALPKNGWRHGAGAQIVQGHGRYERAVAWRADGASVAVDATLRAAAPFQISRRPRPGLAVKIEAGDLRFKQRKQKASVAAIFVVDASGSMAVNRIDQAKGALLRLLDRAYVHRDSVALIGFRGKKAEVVVPLTRSVELARRAVSALAVGGGTPLAAGLKAAETLAALAIAKGLGRPVLVLFTDGRPNIAHEGGDVWREIEEVCAGLRGVASMVVDTRHPFFSGGDAARLAGMLGARYVCLPQPDAGAVYREVAALADAARGAERA